MSSKKPLLRLDRGGPTLPDNELDELEASVGSPRLRWEALLARVQDDRLIRFVDVEREWLALLWCLDSYRIRGIPPRGLGKPTLTGPRRLAAAYRMKGNWFALLVAGLLQNRTHQRIGAKHRVLGFSQSHQVDVAWPPRENDPLICIETKVTGAPAYSDTPARGAMADFSNRRKELKFAATDLKLYRRQDGTVIDHWGAWRSTAPPKTYFLWGARLRTGGRSEDSVVALAREAQALSDTYLEGVGVLAWRTSLSADGYESVALPTWARISVMDDVLHRVASEIRSMAPDGVVPDPIIPSVSRIALEGLLPDEEM